MMSLAKDTLKPTLCEKFGGIIWKIEIDETHKQIAVETRFPTSKGIFLSVFNYTTGQCFVKELRVENDWWWHLDRLHQHTLFLHGYVNENTPEHKGILALDIQTGKPKWQNFQLTLEAIAEEGLIVYNPSFQPKKLQLASAETGIILKSSVVTYKPTDRNIHFPHILDKQTPRPAFLPDTIVGPVHHFHYLGKNCWSFHTKKNELFCQHLLIIQDKTVLLADILAADIPKLNPESFFIQQNSIFYIRDRNMEIASYLL